VVKLISIEEVKVLANTKSAKKRINKSLATGDIETIKEKLRLAVKELDKAVTKGVLHKNTAARKKSRLYAKFNALLKSASNE
jgi:small subunit ribosomal protein S20